MPREAFILLLEDSSDDAALVIRELKQGGINFISKRMATRGAFAEALLGPVPDLVLSDYRLTNFDGLEALAICRERIPDVPFILMSGVAGEELAVEAFKGGAADYVLKDRLYRLPPAVRQALELGERRRVDRAARESEKRFSALTETLPAIVFVTQNNRFMYVNRVVERILGYAPAELLGRSMDEFVPEEFRERARGGWLALLRGETASSRDEIALITRAGEGRRFDCTATAIQFEGKVAILGCAIDVSEQLKAEAALVQSDQRRRLLVEAIPDFIFHLRNDGAVVDFKAPKDAELPAETLASLGRLLVDRALERFDGDERRRQAMQSGEVQAFEFQFPLQNDARDFEARVTVSGPAELLAVVRDVTERKRLETEVLEISALERRRIGHNLHDGLGQYLAGVAVKARILADDLAAEGSAQRAAARKLVRLINGGIQQTRTLARGLDPVEVETSGLAAALRKLASETEELFRVRCRLHSPAEVVPVSTAVGLQLFRIAQEAIANAVNHGRAGQIEIALELDAGQVRLGIQDDGRGFRLRSARGTGMGLRIMKYRTHTLGGALVIDSRPGTGTRIQCVVPLTAPGRFGERPR